MECLCIITVRERESIYVCMCDTRVRVGVTHVCVYV
jgi:hypothetical protein